MLLLPFGYAYNPPPDPTIAPAVNKYVPQQTLQYSTFIKRAIVESLQAAFLNHPDKTVKQAKIGVDTTNDRFKLPAIIIKFFEREMPNAGVGHVEYLVSPQDPDPNNPSLFIKYYHRIYKGDIEFEVFGMSSVDRDIVRDALIEVLAMTDTSDGGTNFISRFYNDYANTPYGLWHFPVLNLDLITGYGEQQMLAPWMPEDTLVYQVSYRVPIIGEFYSRTPMLPSSTGLLQEVDVYPYIEGTDKTPAQDPFTPTNPDWYRFRADNLGPTELI